MMRPSITVVIPVFKLVGLRERNFWYVIQQLLHTNKQIVVVEQHSPGHRHVLKKKIEQMFNSRVSYMSVTIDDHKIHKSKLINTAVVSIRTTHVWVNDADCVMNFKHVIGMIDKTADFVQPYSDSVDLSSDESTHVLKTNRVKLEQSNETTRRGIDMYGALSFVFKRETFMRIGMMDESFTGWGLEDVELHNRVTNKGYQPSVVDVVAYHLWHERPGPNYSNWQTDASRELHPRVIHVVGLMDPLNISCVDNNYRVWMSLQSITEANKTNTLLIGGSTDADVCVPGWKIHHLSREYSDDQPLPYVVDLFRLALAQARPRDKILYTNADCMVSPDIYTSIMNSHERAIEYHRQEVEPHDTVSSCLNNPHGVEHVGVDGFMFTYQTLKQIINDMPDMVVGEPCWDLVVSKLLEKHNAASNNTKLCHIEHEPNWSLNSPTEATHHNVKLARDHLDERYFKQYDNRLKHTNMLCVMVLCCAKEIHDDKLRPMLNRFFTYECSTDKKFDVFICVDTIDKSTNDLLHKQTQTIMSRCDNINNMIIHDVDISPADNMFMYSVDEWYARRAKDPTCLQLGTTSGVNIQFFESVKHVFQNKQQYKHLLLLETDCEPVHTKWYDRVVEQCTRKDFVVMGSKYRGVDDSHRDRWYRDHLNGVAVYRNTPDLFCLLNRASQVIKNHVSDPNTIERWLNFDVAMLQAAIDLNMTDKLVDADIISNYSDPVSSDLNIEQVLSRDTNTIILHKKQHETI